MNYDHLVGKKVKYIANSGREIDSEVYGIDLDIGITIMGDPFKNGNIVPVMCINGPQSTHPAMRRGFENNPDELRLYKFKFDIYVRMIEEGIVDWKAKEEELAERDRKEVNTYNVMTCAFNN